MSYYFEQKADISSLVSGKKVISSTIGPNGEACLLLVDPRHEDVPFRRQRRDGFAVFPRTKSLTVYPATYIRFDGRILQHTELPEVDIAFPIVQPLPHGELMVVGARCDFRGGDPEKNAAVYTPDGSLIRQFVVGDGIADVQVSVTGKIWISYFDEGVFGNFGWDNPMGSSGLVCFDKEGLIQWQFEPPSRMDSIADCYAMNVVSDIVWACYYTDFPLVKVHQEVVRAWKNQIGGATALAVDDQRVLLWGGYGDKRCRCVLQQIGQDTLTNTTELKLGFPAGLDPASARVMGRGRELHALTENSWLVFSMDVI